MMLSKRPQIRSRSAKCGMAALVLLLSLVASTIASAQTTYDYTGPTFDSVFTGSCIGSHLELSFTTPSPIPASQPNTLVPVVTGWTFEACGLTCSNLVPCGPEVSTSIKIGTDASGIPNDWSIIHEYEDMFFGNSNFQSSESLGSPPPSGGDGYHSLENNGEVQQTGTWIVTGGGGPPAVPMGTPASQFLLFLMLTAVGLFWGSRRFVV